MNVVSLEEFKLKRLAIFAAPEDEPVVAEAPAAFAIDCATASEEDVARLKAAALGLHKAAIDQNAKVKKFHRVTLELGDQIRKLEASCKRLDRNIRKIRINPLARSANNLVDTMDGLLATQTT